nr:PREDICTED: N-terminal EF-hand calcium-binding protein 1 [Equus przewalskii]
MAGPWASKPRDEPQWHPPRSESARLDQFRTITHTNVSVSREVPPLTKRPPEPTCFQAFQNTKEKKEKVATCTMSSRRETMIRTVSLPDSRYKSTAVWLTATCQMELEQGFIHVSAVPSSRMDYQEASNLEQFVTRFLLKETLNQLQSLQNSLECAMETTEEQTRQERQGLAKPEVLSIQWPGKRSSRRVQRHNSFSPNSPQFTVSAPGLLEEDNQWMTQINRLQKLIDRLEKKDLKLEPLEEEVVEGNTKSHIMLVQRQMSVIEEDLEEFQLSLKHYVESASSQSGCLRISIQKLTNESRYMIYEFWENSSVWNSHLQTSYSKTFQRSNVDFLETPELTSTMLVPASWWILNNN